MGLNIAIIGAGIAGLTLANELNQNHTVTVFEKSRGPGGRMATRYAGNFEFDHGTQFFTARSSEFQAITQAWRKQNIIDLWKARFVEINYGKITCSRQWVEKQPHYVATPKMNSLGKYLAQDIHIKTTCKIIKLQYQKNTWYLTDEANNNFGPFDWVALAMPVAQIIELLPQESLLGNTLKIYNMSSCYSVMLGYDLPTTLPWDAAVVKESTISWIAANHSKPNRPKSCSILMTSSNAWADAHINTNTEDVFSILFASFIDIVGSEYARPSHQSIHRWRYANAASNSNAKFYIDPKLPLACCGDWCIKGRIEAAWESGKALAIECQRQL